jgi:hypothetical protein
VSRPSADAEPAVWHTLAMVWWETYRDEEVGVGELLQVARDVEGLGLGRGRTRVRQKQLGKLLGRLRGREIGGLRVTPNRVVNGAQLWRLVRVGDLRAVRAAAYEAFVPSSEWQEVPDGYPCPPRGEFRLDFATGKSWARWPEQGGQGS